MRALAVLVAVAVAGCLSPGDLPSAPAPASWSWGSLPPAPTPRTEVTAAAVDGRVFVIGGFTTDMQDPAATFAGAVATNEVLNVATGEWSTGPAFPFPIHHATAVAVSGSVIVFGGFGPAAQPVPTGFRLTDGGWVPVAAMPSGRAAHAAAVVGEKVFVFGGINDAFELESRAFVYDAVTDAWSSIADFPKPRDHLGGAALNGRVYAVAGQFVTHDASVGDVDVYDPTADAWTTVTSVPTLRNSLQAVAFADRVIAFGGQDDERTFRDVEAFDPATASWSTLPPLAVARHGFGAVVVGDQALVLAGGPEPGLSATGDVAVLTVTR